MGARASDVIAERAKNLDSGENHETGRSDGKQADEEQ
jgi:hypothetical protein